MAVSIMKRSMVTAAPPVDIYQLSDGRLVIALSTNPSQQTSAVRQLVISSTSIAVDYFDGTRKTTSLG